MASFTTDHIDVPLRDIGGMIGGLKDGELLSVIDDEEKEMGWGK